MDIQEHLDSAMPLWGYDCITKADLIENLFDADEVIVQLLHARTTFDGLGPKTSVVALTSKRILTIQSEMGKPTDSFEIEHSAVKEINVRKNVAKGAFEALAVKDFSDQYRLIIADSHESESKELARVFREEYSEYEKQREVIEQQEAEQLAREQKVAKDRIASHLDGNLSAAIEAGKPLYHYRWIYIEIDSEINGNSVGSFNFDEIQDAGLEGWKVLSVLPRTVGVGLKNTSMGSTMGESWGGGVGGIVAGAYVILGREVDRGDSAWLEELKEEVIGRIGPR
jgi:hypothetical protein